MKSVSGKEFTKVLERNGWVLLRIEGSHHIMETQEAMYVSLFRFTETTR